MTEACLDDFFFFFRCVGKRENGGWGLDEGAEKEIDIREDYLISDSRGLVSRTNFSSTHVFIEKQKVGETSGKNKWASKGQTGDKKVCDNVVHAGMNGLCPFQGHKPPPGKGDFG